MLKHGILGLLALGDSSGYDISLGFSEGLSYFWVANQSQIYRELNGMERSGWVASYREEQETRPDKRIYTLTAEGRAELIDWLKADGVEQLLVIRSPILMKLFFAGAVEKADVVKLLTEFQAACAKKLERITSIQSESGTYAEENPPYWRYTTDYCDGYYRFLIDWAQRTLEDIRRYL